ncbi:MAG: Fe-S cluster assembly protein SufD [Parachlamydiaceae bacterium]|nr:Fe-S cluster assembly protein SufD [Parachlamydiaceae bacterium]
MHFQLVLAIDDSMQTSKLKAWDQFLKMGLPHNKTEVYRYIHLRRLFGQKYIPSAPSTLKPEDVAPFILPECQRSALVFVNGHFQPHLSRLESIPKRLVVTQLHDAIATYGTFLNNQWNKSLQEETDAFAALNAALHRDGAFLYLPPNTVVETPIQLVNVVDTAETPMLLLPRIHLFVGANSEVTLVSSTDHFSGSAHCLSLVTEMSIEENAHVKYMQTATHNGTDIWHFDALRASLKQNSTLRTINMTEGSATTRYDYRVALIGQNAEALLNGLSMINEKREAHTHVLVDHQAPNCRSMQLFKTILNGFARSSFEGKILVRQAAQKTDAFQRNNNLLLSDNAHADSKPNLEIFADDVKASHGATIGQLDADQLFYMRTRGFPEAMAQNLMVYSFCKDVVDQIPLPSLLNHMTTRAKNCLNEK